MSSTRPLALAELKFPDLHDSPSNPRLGLGYELLQKPVQVNAAAPTTPRIGDVVTLYWDNQQVQRFTVGNTQITLLEFTVPTSYIHPPEGRAYYTYYDPITGETDQSPVRTIAINTLVPGGPGPHPNPPYNNDLAPCVVTPNPVTNLGSPVNVRVPQWLNMEVGDELTVLWGGIAAPVTKVTTPSGDKTVSIPVDILMRAGTQPSLPVTYEIRDIVDNYSGQARPTQVAVQLPVPEVLQNNSPASIIDLESLTKLEARIPNYGMVVGDSVTLSWSGASNRTTTQTVGAVGPLLIDIPLNWAQENKDRQVAVTYIVNRGGRTLTSSSANIGVVEGGGGELNLPAPTVQDMRNGELDYYWLTGNRNSQATVVVPQYQGMAVGHTVRVRWKNRSEYFTDIVPVTKVGPMEFKIRNIEIIDTIGGSADVNYSVVTSTGAPVSVSAIFQCRVKAQPNGLNLVAPTMNRELDNARVNYTGSSTRHTVSVRWYEPIAGWSRSTEVKRPERDGYYINFAIPTSWAAANKGKRVYINYSMGDDRDSGPNDHLKFSQYLRLDIP